MTPEQSKCTDTLEEDGEKLVCRKCGYTTSIPTPVSRIGSATKRVAKQFTPILDDHKNRLTNALAEIGRLKAKLNCVERILTDAIRGE